MCSSTQFADLEVFRAELDHTSLIGFAKSCSTSRTIGLVIRQIARVFAKIQKNEKRETLKIWIFTLPLP